MPSATISPEADASIPPGSPAPSSEATDAPLLANPSPAAGVPLPLPGDVEPPNDPSGGAPPLYGEPDLAPVSYTMAGFALGVEWVVPTFLITVPGFLLIGIGLAQAVGGFAWLPLVRRLMSGDGRRRRP
jgi:hypothetical protein